MKKRLLAWLLVFCMTVSLVPGAAFAADGGGGNIIIYDLNDGKSTYQLQLTADVGSGPANKPGAIRTGYHFEGWTNDKEGSEPATYESGKIVYAKWSSGYNINVYLHMNNNQTAETGTFHVEETGKLDKASLTAIENLLSADENWAQKYILEGWYTDAACTPDNKIAGGLEGMIPEYADLHAKWVEIYTITFEFGDPNENKKVSVDASTGLDGTVNADEIPDPPTDTKLSFKGWNTHKKDRNGKDIIITHEQLETQVFKETSTLTAVWGLPFIITFNAQDGQWSSGKNEVQVKTDDNGNYVFPETMTTRADAVFKGWYKPKANTTTPPTLPAGGDEIEAGKPVCTGIVQEYVDNDGMSTLKDEIPDTIYAYWFDLIGITINYNNGSGGDKAETIYLDENGMLTDEQIREYFALPDRPGSTFIGWYVGMPLPTTDQTAFLGVNEYSDTFKDKVEFCTTVDQLKGTTFSSTNNVVNALWKRGYGVSFNYNLPANIIESDIVNTPTNINVKWSDINCRIDEPDSEPSLEAKGYTFLGWYDAEEGGNKITFSKESGSSTAQYTLTKYTTLYAHWGAPYKITYIRNENNSGIGDAGVTAEECLWTTGPANNPNQYPTFPVLTDTSTHKFTGWYTSAACTTKASGSVSKPTTVYAGWELINKDENPPAAPPVTSSLSMPAAAPDSSPMTVSVPSVHDGDSGDADTDPPAEERTTWEITFEAGVGTLLPGQEKAQADKKTKKLLNMNSLPVPTIDKTTYPAYEFIRWENEKGEEVTIDSDFEADTKLIARWKEGYNITFKLLNGATPATIPLQTDKDGTLAKVPEDPTRKGYTFVRWVNDETKTSVTDGAVFTQDTFVSAEWKQDEVVEGKYTIQFNANGGSVSPSSATTNSADDKLSVLPTPTWEGHSFNGWFTAQTDGDQVTVDTVFEANATIYAHWTKEWKITLNANGGTLATDHVYTQGGVLATDLPIPTRSGYEFVGWYDALVGGNLVTNQSFTGDTTLYARWSDSTVNGNHIVTFIVNTDEDAARFQMTTGVIDGKKVLYQLPTLLNYKDGNGWRLENGTHVTKAWVYTAATNLYVDSVKTFKITFNWNDESGKLGTTVVDTGPDGIVPAGDWPRPVDYVTREGYCFEAWYRDTNFTPGKDVPSNTPFTEDTTLYAHWIGPYTITFDPNGGEFTGDVNAKPTTNSAGSLDPTKIPKDPVWEGATFGGWSATKENPVKVDNPAKDPFDGPTTFYAIWTGPYTITLNVNGGNPLAEGEDTVKTDENGAIPKLPEPTHTKDGFAGWFTALDETGVEKKQGDTVTEPTTLYAKWERQPPYDITFHANGGEKDEATMDPEGVDMTKTYVTLTTDYQGNLLEEPERPVWKGHTFAGWFDKPGAGQGTELTNLKGPYDGNTTDYYAHWSSFDYVVTFDYNLGSIGVSPNLTKKETTKEGVLPTLPKAESGEYAITGWYKSDTLSADSKVEKGDVIIKDTTLYAKWEKGSAGFTSATVTFMSEDGQTKLVTLEVDARDNINPMPEPPYKQGYTFDGWYTRPIDGTEPEQITETTPIHGDKIVYPEYSKVYTITFDPNYEDGDTTTAKTEGGKLTSLPTPTRPGYQFDGWFKVKDSNKDEDKVTLDTKFKEDTTVYAHWTKDGEEPGGPGGDDPNKPDDPNNPNNPDDPNNPNNPGNTGPTEAPFTITFDANGGLCSVTTALTDMNGRLTSLPPAQRTGYTLDGWYNGDEKVTSATVFKANTTVTAKWTTGSGSSGSANPGEETFAIAVESSAGGRATPSSTYAKEGDFITVTVRPYSGYQLDSIYVVNSRGRDIALRDLGSNRYTFYMPASRVTIQAEFKELTANTNTPGGGAGSTTPTTPDNSGFVPSTPSPITSGMGVFSAPVLNTLPMPYSDIKPSDWFYSSADYLWKRSLMGGVSNTQFGPNALTSNAMVWTLLARLGGVDVASGSGIWYENARTWAVSNKISDGVGPNNPITREELATMLWRFKGSPSANYDLGQFSDRGLISTYQAECALAWAAANNIITGSNNRLNPRGNATRAEVAVMVTRFCQNSNI